MKKLILGSLLLLTAISSCNLDAGHRHRHGPRVNLNIGNFGAPAVAIPVATPVYVQQPVYAQQPVYVQQPAAVPVVIYPQSQYYYQAAPVVVRQPLFTGFNFGFSFGL